jgi:hypothetical protein
MESPLSTKKRTRGELGKKILVTLQEEAFGNIFFVDHLV